MKHERKMVKRYVILYTFIQYDKRCAEALPMPHMLKCQVQSPAVSTQHCEEFG